MKYNKTVKLKDGRKCILRSGNEADAKAVLDIFKLTHEQTDLLLSYPDEITFTIQQEADFLKGKEESEDSIEILAVVDGVLAGTAGFDKVGGCYKVRHRAEFGISVDKAHWGIGIGQALTEACVECAKAAGYTQLELNVLAENERAISLYRKMGFAEYGRNPKGFNSRINGYNEIVYMRLEL